MYIGDFNRVKGYRSLAAAVAEERCLIQKSNVREAFSVHREHSMETVAVLNDITYINNSVSTTINSTWYAFEETKGPTIWMAGGASAPNDYSILLKPILKNLLQYDL
jgi:UDP-N-acetylmuramoylalanine-D-glutamate ligase